MSARLDELDVWAPGSRSGHARSSVLADCDDPDWVLRTLSVYVTDTTLSTASSFLNPPYSPPFLLRRRQAPRLRRFARSRILTVQASTPPVHSVAKRRSHRAWRPLATEGWWIRRV